MSVQFKKEKKRHFIGLALPYWRLLLFNILVCTSAFEFLRWNFTIMIEHLVSGKRKRKENKTKQVIFFFYIFLRLFFYILKSGQPRLCLFRGLAKALQVSFCCACQERAFIKKKSKIDFNSKERFSQISLPFIPSVKQRNLKLQLLVLFSEVAILWGNLVLRYLLSEHQKKLWKTLASVWIPCHCHLQF